MLTRSFFFGCDRAFSKLLHLQVRAAAKQAKRSIGPWARLVSRCCIVGNAGIVSYCKLGSERVKMTLFFRNNTKENVRLGAFNLYPGLQFKFKRAAPGEGQGTGAQCATEGMLHAAPLSLYVNHIPASPNTGQLVPDREP